jgi:hypothetical protein
LHSLSGVLLLILYTGGNVQIESFHQLFHAYEKDLHSFEQEKDPCHRAIYHEAQKNGCDHKTHLTEVKKCPLCHVVPHNEEHIAVSHSFESHSWLENFSDNIYSRALGEFFINLSDRGPPHA